MTRFFGNASSFSKVSFILTIFAMGIHCGGYSTHYWMKSHTISNALDFTVGLWKVRNCSGYYGALCYDSAIPDTYYTDLLVVTQALESCTLVMLVIMMIVSAFYVTSPAVRILKTAVVILIMGLVSFLLSAGGTIAWMFNIPDKHYPYWSMGLTVIAAAIAILCSVLMIPDIRRYDYDVIKKEHEERKEKRKKKKDEERAEAIREKFSSKYKKKWEPSAKSKV